MCPSRSPFSISLLPLLLSLLGRVLVVCIEFLEALMQGNTVFLTCKGSASITFFDTSCTFSLCCGPSGSSCQIWQPHILQKPTLTFFHAPGASSHGNGGDSGQTAFGRRGDLCLSLYMTSMNEWMDE